MKTPGFLTDTLFYLRTLTTISVLSIALQIHSQVKDTSAENTFTNYENLEVVVGELEVKATGKNTTEVLLNLLKTVNSTEIWSSNEIIDPHKSKGLTNFEETRQLFLNNVLTEAMSDGTPAFYNSNILGRIHAKRLFPN